MTVYGDVLYGRRAVERLILDLMRRTVPDDSPPRRSSPVLVLVGARGAGKTRLLDILADGFRWQVPYARLDFAAHRDITVRQVLRFLAFELNRWCADYGRIGFGRFLVGELAMSLDLDLLDRGQARARVEDVLERHRNVERLRTFLQVLAEDVSYLVASPVSRTAAEYGAGLLLEGLVRWRPTRRVVLGRATEWYGRTPRGVRADPLDTLVDLSRGSRSDDPRERAAVDGLALAAFLADLDEQFGDGYPVHRRPRYCPVLLDNTDTGSGPEFLDRLVESYRERARAGRGVLPLTVVATAQQCRPGTTACSAEEASHVEWAARSLAPDGSPRGDDVWRYQVALRDLSAAELHDLAVSRRLPDPKRTSRFVHRLTGGHPDASALFTEALAAALPGRPRAEVATVLRCVFGLPAPGSASGPLSEYVRGRLLGELDADLVGWLVTLSAARTVTDGFHALATGVGPELPPELGAAGGWVIADGQGSRALHPLPRRLLLAELAARRPGPGSWDDTHQRLLDYCHDVGDRDGVLYHALAMERVPEVTKELAADLAVADAEAGTWFGRLAAITSAPNRLVRQDAPLRSVERFLQAVGAGDPVTSVLAQLTAARWIRSDPLGDPGGELHGLMASAYRRLAQLSPNGFEVLMAEADRHDRWRSSGD